MRHRPRRLTQRVVERIREIAANNPGLGLRQIGYHFSPPLSHDTVGKVLRGERGATIDLNGRKLNPGGNGRKRTRAQHIPRSDRERFLAEFWYQRGRKEAEIMSSPQFQEALNRSVEIEVADFAKAEGRSE
jgi:hypothetical protein